jgi:hypothetical protein
MTTLHCNMLILRTHVALVMSHLVLNGVGVGAGNGGLGSWILVLVSNVLVCYGWLLCLGLGLGC